MEGDQFGDVEPQIETIKLPLRHAGQYKDEESRLFYNYSRYYDPKTGRYLRSDPIENRINYFMKSNNRLPNVNEYLELNQSALDSYGNVLTFKKNGERFKVYSLGSNEKDENGKGDDIFIVDEERESKKFQCEEKTKQGWNFCPAISKP